MFKDLGKETVTYGCFTHAKATAIMVAMPNSILNKTLFPLLTKQHAKEVANGKADKK